MHTRTRAHAHTRSPMKMKNKNKHHNQLDNWTRRLFYTRYMLNIFNVCIIYIYVNVCAEMDWTHNPKPME